MLPMLHKHELQDKLHTQHMLVFFLLYWVWCQRFLMSCHPCSSSAILLSHTPMSSALWVCSWAFCPLLNSKCLSACLVIYIALLTYDNGVKSTYYNIWLMQQNTGLKHEPEKSFWPLWKVTSENFITYPGVLLVSVKFAVRLPWLTGSRERQTDSVQGTRFVALGWTQHKICKNKEKDVNLLNIFNLIKYAAAKKNYYKSGLCNIIQKHGISSGVVVVSSSLAYFSLKQVTKLDLSSAFVAF